MYVDKQLMFSEAQDLGATTEVTTYHSTNVIDLGAIGMYNAGGVGMEIVIDITESIAGSSSTVQFQLETDDDNAWTGSTVIAQTTALAEAAMTAGSEPIKIAVPANADRYLRLNFIVGTAALTTGIIDAFLTIDRQTNRG